jgi:hypothetical protein
VGRSVGDGVDAAGSARGDPLDFGEHQIVTAGSTGASKASVIHAPETLADAAIEEEDANTRLLVIDRGLAFGAPEGHVSNPLARRRAKRNDLRKATHSHVWRMPERGLLFYHTGGLHPSSKYAGVTIPAIHARLLAEKPKRRQVYALSRALLASDAEVTFDAQDERYDVSRWYNDCQATKHDPDSPENEFIREYEKLFGREAEGAEVLDTETEPTILKFPQHHDPE